MRQLARHRVPQLDGCVTGEIGKGVLSMAAHGVQCHVNLGTKSHVGHPAVPFSHSAVSPPRRSMHSVPPGWGWQTCPYLCWGILQNWPALYWLKCINYEAALHGVQHGQLGGAGIGKVRIFPSHQTRN